MKKLETVLLRQRAPGKGWGKIVRGTARHMLGSELKVYCELIGYADKDNYDCYPSVKKIVVDGTESESNVISPPAATEHIVEVWL